MARTALLGGQSKVIGFDMGGTSTDVSHFIGEFEREFETQVAGVRVRAPMMSIHTVAAGGGSVLSFDGARFRAVRPGAESRSTNRWCRSGPSLPMYSGRCGSSGNVYAERRTDDRSHRTAVPWAFRRVEHRETLSRAILAAPGAVQLHYSSFTSACCTTPFHLSISDKTKDGRSAGPGHRARSRLTGCTRRCPASGKHRGRAGQGFGCASCFVSSFLFRVFSGRCQLSSPSAVLAVGLNAPLGFVCLVGRAAHTL